MVFRFFTILSLLVMCFQTAIAFDHDYEMRVSWIKTLKVFLSTLEKKESRNLKLSVEEKRFLRDFSLFKKAWADSRFDCIYGGWPSTLVSHEGKRLCSSPKSRSDFQNNPCSERELKCQPLLFGPSLCAPFADKQDMQTAFSSCEKKFQNAGGNYEYLRNLGPRDLEDLRELSVLAGDICKKNTPMCRELLNKIDDGLTSIDRGWRESTRVTAEAPVPGAAIVPEEEPIISCVEAEPEESSLQQISSRNYDEMYESMKQNFERSAFCDPMKVVSNPAERPNPFLLAELFRDMTFFELLPFNRSLSSDTRMNQLISRYRLNSEAQSRIRALLPRVTSNGLNSPDRTRAILEMRTQILQDFSRDGSAQNQMKETVRSKLAENHIFRKESDGSVSCPFITKDAFIKAMEGRARVLSQHRRSLPKQDQLTIVDYTRPSNERRMFVIDLNSQKVLHNTWVAHGGGDGNGPGADGLGSSPAMSNVNGSNLSSDGFVIAGQPSHGARFGPNVILRGIDQANTNLASRSVILHGWGAPMDDFTNGVSLFEPSSGTYAPPQDPVKTLSMINPSTAADDQLQDALRFVRSSTWIPKYLQPTEGCLGVPKVNMSHLDQRGRNQTQLENLRQDLPGSLIFNYSGPQMQSRYLQ